VLLRKISGQEMSRRLTGHPRGSIQTPNGSCSNDAATLERENEDLKVICIWCIWYVFVLIFIWSDVYENTFHDSL